MRKRKVVAAAAALAACGALGMSAGAAPAAVTVGHSGWNWGNPLPQGNNLAAIEFAGTRGYAVGAFGTVVRTDDAGATWTGLPTGVLADLDVVRTVTPDVVVVGGGCVARRSTNGGGSFSRIPIFASDTGCPNELATLDFPTADVGYFVLADGTVLRTPDAGRGVVRRSPIPGTRAQGGQAVPTDLLFTAADVGIASTGAGKLQRTVDGGNTWVEVLNAPVSLNAVTLADATTAYAVGNDSRLYKSNNAGESWFAKPLTIPGNPSLTGIRCASKDICVMTVRDGDRLIRTADGGETVTSISASQDKLRAVAFASATRGVVVGDLGATVVSNDAGQTYTPIGTRLTGDFTGLDASGRAAFAFGAAGALARSTDKGATWASLGVSTSQDIRDVSFPNENVGYVLDAAGGLLRTDNAGATWSNLNTGTSARPPALIALSPNTVLLIGGRGVRRSTNGGQEFTAVRGSISSASLGDVDRGGSGVFVYGSRALYLSVDGGRRWRAVPRPGSRRNRLDKVDFVSASRGYALLTNGRLYETRNRGRRWSEIVTTGYNDVSDMWWQSATRGFVKIGANAVSDPDLLRTTDGGRTWRPQLISSAGLQDVAIGADVDYALSGGSYLFATESGGDAGRASTLTLSASPRRLNRAGRVRISGRLTPPEGFEQVRVAYREARGATWRSTTATVASNGTFTVNLSIRRTTLVVAQWRGDDDRQGDGSPTITVRVGRR